MCAADAWSKFDEDEAVMALENEGKSNDEPGWTLRAKPGVAVVHATDYVKDKEEVALDRDLTTKRSELQAPRGKWYSGGGGGREEEVEEDEEE